MFKLNYYYKSILQPIFLYGCLIGLTTILILFINFFLDLKIDIEHIQISFDLSLLIIILLYFNLSKDEIPNIISVDFKEILLIAALSLLISISFAYYNYSYFYRSYIMNDFNFSIEFEISNIQNYNYYSLLRILLILPVLEEIFYRYILFKKFNLRLPAFISIFISSLLFSLTHLDFENFSAIAIVGVTLGYVYHITKKILIPILIHFGINFLNIFTNYSDTGLTSLYAILLFIVSNIVIVLLVCSFNKTKSFNHKGY
jgi:membrane protease YdiL (CAAX protease family)